MTRRISSTIKDNFLLNGKENNFDFIFGYEEGAPMASRVEERGGTGSRRTEARDPVPGGWPTDSVIGLPRTRLRSGLSTTRLAL